MALGDMFKKVFVPENQEPNVGTPEQPEAAPPRGNIPPENDAFTADGPGKAAAPSPGVEESQNPGGQLVAPPPSPEDNTREYHYSAFGEENETGLWNQHTRIVLAIAMVLLSAIIMWWILI